MTNSGTPTAIEAPSGKNQEYENFPVGSWLLPAHLRPHIATFYWFARTIDDIADSNFLSAEEKVQRLSRFEETLLGQAKASSGFEKAQAMRQSLQETGITDQHCRDLVTAFKRDATKSRYVDWPDLMDYCRYSASPVGRYLIDLHGGSEADYPPSDALCSALQILNHLQDCKEDFETLDRVYLPLDVLEQNGALVTDLAADSSSQGLRNVILNLLLKTAELIEQSRELPLRLSSRRLAIESQAIINIANQLKLELTRRDPVAERVKLSKFQYVSCCARGALRAALLRRL